MQVEGVRTKLEAAGARLAEKKREEATVSFHYLVREKQTDSKAPQVVPFTAEEYKAFCEKLVAQPNVDLTDDETCKAFEGRDRCAS